MKFLKPLAITLLVQPPPLFGLTLDMPPRSSDLIGQVRIVASEESQTLQQIGQQHDVGFYEMHEANLKLPIERPLAEGTEVVVPTQYILPPGPRRGLVINIAEMRMYYYLPNKKQVMTYPIGIGREGWATPLGQTKIVRKKASPTWYVPETIRMARAKDGVFLPKVVRPGPENPLGNHAFYLGFPTYLIHGTNMPEGVGRRVTAGCIRMYPKDIAELFRRLPVNTPVRIMNRPYKLGWEGRELLLEAHEPIDPDERVAEKTRLSQFVKKAIKKDQIDIDWNLIEQLSGQESGIPELVGFLSE